MIDLSKLSELLSSKSNRLPIDKKELEYILDLLFHQILFPICKNDTQTDNNLHIVHSVLLENISNLLNQTDAKKIVYSFINQLPALQEALWSEADCFLKNDPAAKSVEEVILAYPGFFALAVHRISNLLHKLQVPLIPRIFSEYAHSKVGVDIHPGAQIGSNFFIDHGTGIVIGETTIIGENVKIYQGVTLGALFVAKSLKGLKRHPTIEDNVVIYAGATILGGRTIIGHDSTIGGNVWLTKSIVPHSTVFHHAEISIKNEFDSDDPLNYYI